MFLIWSLTVAGFATSCLAAQSLADSWWLQDSPEKVLAMAQSTNFSPTWNVTDFVGNSIVQQIQIDPLLAYTVNGTNLVTGDSHTYSLTSFPYAQTNSFYFATNNSVTVSNMLPGSYRVTFIGLTRNTAVTNIFPYGTSGNPIASQTNYLGVGGKFTQGGVFTVPSLQYTGLVSGSNVPGATVDLELTTAGTNTIATIASSVIVSSNGVTAIGVSNIVNPIVLASSNGVLATASNAFYLKSNPSNYVTATITNGLATTAYVTGQGYVTQTVTNGLATIAYVNAATNGHVTASITNGLATMAYVTGQGFVTQSITNGLVTASITNGLATANFVNAGILSSTNNVLILSSNSFYAKSNPSNFVEVTDLNSASNYLQSLIVITTNGITAVTATNIANSSSAAALTIATNYANTNSIAQGAASTNYTTSVSNLVYVNATNSAGSIAGNIAYNATNNFVGTMNAAILSATNAFTNKVNAMILAATNAIGTASGLAAFQNTNFFDLAGAGTAAALASTNGLPTMAFASTNQFIRTNALPTLTNSFATTNLAAAMTNNFGNSVAINMTNPANQLTALTLSIGGSMVGITNIFNNTNTILAGGTSGGTYFYAPYTNTFNGSYVSTVNGSYSLTNNGTMFAASSSLTNIYSLVSSNWVLGGTPLMTTAYTYYLVVTNYPVVINTAIITNGVYVGNGGALTNLLTANLVGTLNGTNLIGTLTNNAATATAAGTATNAAAGGNIVTNHEIGVTLGGTFTNSTYYGDGGGLTNLGNSTNLAQWSAISTNVLASLYGNTNQYIAGTNVVLTTNGGVVSINSSGTAGSVTNAISNNNGTGTNLTVQGYLASTSMVSQVTTIVAGMGTGTNGIIFSANQPITSALKYTFPHGLNHTPYWFAVQLIFTNGLDSSQYTNGQTLAWSVT